MNSLNTKALLGLIFLAVAVVISHFSEPTVERAIPGRWRWSLLAYESCRSLDP
jgi:hypothetical protein